MIAARSDLARTIAESTWIGVAVIAIGLVLLLGAQWLEWHSARTLARRALLTATALDLALFTTLVVLRFAEIA
jgi:hypothetical protein